MALSKRPSSWFFGVTLLTPLALAGCPESVPSGTSFTTATSLTLGTSVETTLEGGTEADESETDTDPGTESTDDTGDGDGDGDGGDGDGDGDPGTETDTDTDTAGPGCSDEDSGAPPFDNDDVFAPGDEPEPHGNFVPQVDVPLSECDIFMQDCVPGEKCVPYASGGMSWDANKCVPVLGDGMVGEACLYAGTVEATDDCDESSACWDVMDVNGESVGTCTAFCMGTTDAPICPAGTACLQGNEGSIAFCVEGCNPLTQECPNGEACFWTTDAFACVFTTEDLPTGDTCGYINDCAAGNMCVTAQSVPNCNGSACCAAFCDLDCGMGVCMQPGTECVPFFEMGQAPIGSADVGVCLSM